MNEGFFRLEVGRRVLDQKIESGVARVDVDGEVVDTELEASESRLAGLGLVLPCCCSVLTPARNSLVVDLPAAMAPRDSYEPRRS